MDGSGWRSRARARAHVVAAAGIVILPLLIAKDFGGAGRERSGMDMCRVHADIGEAQSRRPGSSRCSRMNLEYRNHMSMSHNLNDEGGYDVIVLPNGERSRVFTRKDLRLNSDGSVKTFKGKGKSQSNIGRRKPLVQRKGHQKTITKYFENTKKRRVDSQTLTFPNTGE